MTLLAATGLTVRYGATLAVDGVDLTAYRGEVLALIGPNGAGKSTILDAIGGTAPAAGSVVLDGAGLTGVSPVQRRRLGVGRVFQTPRLAGPTALDDVVLAATDLRSLLVGLVRPPRRAERAHAAELLNVVGLAHDLWHEDVTRLGLPERRRVELARALAGDPRLLLLDEPASGLPDYERGRFAELISALAGPERGVVLVEHDMALVAATAHHVVALAEGRVIARGSYADVAADDGVRTSYLGADHAEAPRRRRKPTAETSPVIAVDGLTARHGVIDAVHGVDLSVAAGEVVAVLGPNGAGKSTLARCLSGLHADYDGIVSVRGVALPPGDPRARHAAGLVAVSDTRDLVPTLSVDRYLALALDLDGVVHAHTLFPRVAELGGRKCGSLSGGEAQMVTLARALGAHPTALVVDELSQGLAPVALFALLPAVRAAADAGCAVLLVEQFAYAAALIADRVVMLEGGRVGYNGSVATAPLRDGYLKPGEITPPPPTPILTDVTVGLLPVQRRALAAAADAAGTVPGVLVRDAIDALLAQPPRVRPRR